MPAIPDQPQHGNTPQTNKTQRPKLTCDWQEWAAYLEHVDAPDSEKQQIIEELWNVVVAFVDLGWDIQPPPAQKTCGQTLDLTAVLRDAVVNSGESQDTQKEAV